MKAKIFGLLLCVSIFLVGCATVKPGITDTRTFAGSFDDVWRATVQTLAERALPVSSIEKDSGLITTDLHIIDYSVFGQKTLENIAVHPNVALGIWENPEYSVKAFLSSEGPNRTQIKIKTHIEAFERHMTDAWYVCYSNGIIEKNILDAIQSKVDEAQQRISADSDAPIRKIIGYRGSMDPNTGKIVTSPVYEVDEQKK
jgi:hypothetical protein